MPLQDMFAIYAPTTTRSIVNATGTFVPQVPEIVNWLLKAESEGIIVVPVMAPARPMLPKLLQDPLKPPDDVLEMLAPVSIPCSVKEFPVVCPELI